MRLDEGGVTAGPEFPSLPLLPHPVTNIINAVKISHANFEKFITDIPLNKK